MVIEVTKAARIMVETAAKESNATGLPLRIAAVRTPEGGLDYRMGFDEEGIKFAPRRNWDAKTKLLSSIEKAE